jgi:hypothetical protein
MKINKVKFLKAQSLFEQRQYAAAIKKIKQIKWMKIPALILEK